LLLHHGSKFLFTIEFRRPEKSKHKLRLEPLLGPSSYSKVVGTVAYARKLNSKTRLKINYLMQADNSGTVPRHSLGIQVLRAF
jgi:hypothetical protein